APLRNSPVSPRAPSTSDRASMRIDLPAPVSPENTVKPGAKLISASSTITKSRTCSRRSMAFSFGLGAGLGHVVPVQLAAQGGEVAVAGGVDEPHAVVGAAHLDVVAGLNF